MGYPFRYPLRFILLSLHLFVTGESATSTTDTLSQTGSLSDGQTLISLNKTFELGFFSPNGSSNRYVGIWYYKIPLQTPVWIANRNNPLLDTSGVLYINNNGELMIVDRIGRSFVVAYYNPGGKDVEATILDSGNLVLRETNNSSSIIWQSFDYPTDTWLPGMKLGVTEGQHRLTTSWRSSSDPTTGDFAFGLDSSQLFIWQKNVVSWSSGLWNGTSFAHNPELSEPPFGSLNFVSDSEGVYCTFSSIYYTRFVVDMTGQTREFTWVDSQGDWVLFWSVPHATCEVYNVCGVFGLCNDMALPACTCVQGFVPASQSDWDNGDKSRGCVRQSRLQCSTSQ
ncbi:hypothetical protein LUZ61_004584 [Rhynchospora tenuis]|uniref:non-specific serine/threonine protein kinase n=1 Tax=Rhynchospora tenuis TaxID=198213 RepID=A0AAD5ZN06_9POAL|nr:hypothetical protein LUZ61_004584 [Rhynchospora tenuis]